jgi:lipopolysaccharide cholinephosphotransferase
LQKNFTMSEHINELQEVQLEIALEVKHICDKLGLQYFLIGGTLLGAVRHKGFIPWDDDFDIGMPRKDYDKFILYCSKKLNAKYYLHCHETDPEYWLNYAKIRRNGTLFDEKSIRKIDTHKGIFIDIFPLDNVISPDSRVLKLQSILVSHLTIIIFRMRGLDLKYNFNRKQRILYSIMKLLKISSVAKLQQRIMMIHNNRSTAYWVSFGSNYSHITETMPKDKYLPSKHLKFEGILFKVPADYDFVLTRLFGDYMIPPPVSQRVGRHAVQVRLAV